MWKTRQTDASLARSVNFTYRYGVVEKLKAKRARRTSRIVRPPKSVITDSSAASTLSSDQAAALALGLGPRFNWLEHKINTMQAHSINVKSRPPVLLSSTVTASKSWLDASNGDPASTTSTVVVATATTTTSSTISSAQTSIVPYHCDVVTTQSSVDLGWDRLGKRFYLDLERQGSGFPDHIRSTFRAKCCWWDLVYAKLLTVVTFSFFLISSLYQPITYEKNYHS